MNAFFRFSKTELITAIVVFTFAFLIFNVSPLDLLISDLAFQLTGFEDCSVLSTLALVGKFSGIAYGLFLLKNLFLKCPQISSKKQEAFFLISVLLLGPGIINNYILKPTFSRPRPQEIERYNTRSDKSFVKVLVPSPENAGKSFPSGHAGAGFFLLAPWFIRRIRDKYGWNLFVAAFLWGGAVSVFRILQGKHFFSDCLGSLCVVYFVSLILSSLFGLYQKDVKA